MLHGILHVRSTSADLVILLYSTCKTSYIFDTCREGYLLNRQYCHGAKNKLHGIVPESIRLSGCVVNSTESVTPLYCV